MSWVKVPDWHTLPGVHHSRPDPFVIWAVLTGWRDYPSWESLLKLVKLFLNGQTFVGDEALRPVILELSPDLKKRMAFWVEVDKPAVGNQIRIASRYLPTKNDFSRLFLTAQVTPLGLALLALKGYEVGEGVRRFDLSDVVIPGRVRLEPSNVRMVPPVLGDKVLLGLVDDGCAFAHAAFSPVVADGVFATAPDKSTRVAAYWSQQESSDDEATPAYGGECERFGYGHEIWRTYPHKPSPPAPPPCSCWSRLRALFGRVRSRPAGPPQDHRRGFANLLQDLSKHGAIDEDLAYELAGMPSMRRRVVHGPHVMDIYAGAVRSRHRIYKDRETPPTWQIEGDLAANPDKSDIVFVQLPKESLQDSSGAWLDSHLLDAVHYIASCANEKTPRTVVNISYGNTVGPHDGSTILDQAFAACHGEYRDLHIVLAAGNSFDARGHAHFSLDAQNSFELTWRVPPGSEAPHFLQLWFPKGKDMGAGVGAAQVQLTIIPPGQEDKLGSPIAVDQVHVWPDRQAPEAVMAFLAHPSRAEDSAMAFIALRPTHRQERSPVAAHGDWRVKLTATGPVDNVHAFVARNDRDMGAVLRGRQSWLVDVLDEDDRFLRRPIDDPTFNELDTELFGSRRDGTHVKRRGTLNGVATGSGVLVAAGYNRNFDGDPSEGQHAPYSSAGWNRQIPPIDDRTYGPTVAMPTDESTRLRGLRAAGSRSGSVIRLVGTSAAAPQFARVLANDEPLPSNSSSKPRGDELFGNGRLPIADVVAVQQNERGAAETTATSGSAMSRED